MKTKVIGYIESYIPNKHLYVSNIETNSGIIENIDFTQEIENACELSTLNQKAMNNFKGMKLAKLVTTLEEM